MSRWLSWLLLALGASMLALNLIGEFAPPIRKDPHSHYELEGYSFASKSLWEAREAIELASPLSPDKSAPMVFDAIFRSYIHLTSGAYRIAPWDNWYLSLRGLFHPRYLQSQDGEFLWARGGGFCDQAAMVFVNEARKLGFEGRIVWLGGHVIAEVHIPERGWKAADVDHGIFWNADVQTLVHEVSPENFRSEFTSRGYSLDHANAMQRIYYSMEDNRRSFYPYLPELYQHERFASYVKWVVPIFLLLLFPLVRRCMNNERA